MAPPRYSTAQPPPSRAMLVVGLYGGLALVSILLSAWRGDADIYRIDETRPALHLIGSPLLGAVIGLLVVAGTRFAVARWEWARVLHQSFRDLLGPLTGKEIAILAGASAIGEELLFRGALQPWIGVWAQAAVFALLHIGPGRRFLPWTAWAFAVGLGFGYLAEASGDLGGTIVAHFTINFLNLRYIARADLPRLERSTPSTAPAAEP
jgi:membrane protease YdiL (CAAX protease family)